jgi:hypothetical protein
MTETRYVCQVVGTGLLMTPITGETADRYFTGGRVSFPSVMKSDEGVTYFTDELSAQRRLLDALHDEAFVLECSMSRQRGNRGYRLIWWMDRSIRRDLVETALARLTPKVASRAPGIVLRRTLAGTSAK